MKEGKGRGGIGKAKSIEFVAYNIHNNNNNNDKNDGDDDDNNNNSDNLDREEIQSSMCVCKCTLG